MGVNQFSHLTLDQFKLQGSMFSSQPVNPTSVFTPVSGVQAALSVDWRKKGAVQEVLHQQNCSSCWSFSTVSI